MSPFRLLLTFIGVVASWALHGATLAEALDEPHVVWTAYGTPPWYVQSTNTHDGLLAAQSGAISRGQTSVIEVLVTNASKVAFWARTDGFGGADYLRCFIGGGEA